MNLKLTRLLLIFFSLSSTLLNSGCLRTRLEPISQTEQDQRLAQSNAHKPLLTSISYDFNSPLTTGHQFLFIFIPFGALEIEQANSYMQPILFRQLALLGFQPIACTDASPNSLDTQTACLDPDKNSPQRYLKIDIRDIQLSAYDFIFFRRASCQLELEARLIKYDHGQSELLRSRKTHFSDSQYLKLAFRPQMQRFMNKCLSDAIDDLMTNLPIFP